MRQLVIQYNNYFGIKCESEEGVCTYLSGVLLYMIVIRARDSSRDWTQLKFTQDEDKVGTRKKQKLLAHDCFKLENWIYKVTYIKKDFTRKKTIKQFKNNANENRIKIDFLIRKNSPTKHVGPIYQCHIFFFSHSLFFPFSFMMSQISGFTVQLYESD